MVKNFSNKTAQVTHVPCDIRSNYSNIWRKVVGSFKTNSLSSRRSSRIVSRASYSRQSRKLKTSTLYLIIRADYHDQSQSLMYARKLRVEEPFNLLGCHTVSPLLSRVVTFLALSINFQKSHCATAARADGMPEALGGFRTAMTQTTKGIPRAIAASAESRATSQLTP